MRRCPFKVWNLATAKLMEADYKLTAAAFSYSCTYVQTRILLMVNISAIYNYYSNGFNWS